MHRQDVLNMLARHRSRFMEEASYVRRSYEYIQQNPACFERSQPMHITGSCWVVNPARDSALLMHHKKLGQWFQPGGHADGETDVKQVALRETIEETGLSADKVKLLSDQVFDVDIHSVKADARAPYHEHIDIRFLVEIDDSLVIPGNNESHEIIWVPLNFVSRFNNNMSTRRMVQKTRLL